MKIYNYLIKSHLDELVCTMRHEYNPEEKVRMYLDNKTNMYIDDYVPHAFINAVIFNILDSFEVYENREKFIFFEDYSKDVPLEYMSRIKDALLEMDFNDKVILLPHILTQIKDAFFVMATVMDHVIHLDHSLDDYLDAFDESEEFRELVERPDLDPYNEDPYVLKEKLEAIPDKFMSSINIKPIRELMKSGVKVNKKQILQNFVWGFVPDKLNPKKMEDEFVMEGCITGYNTLSSIYIDGNIGRTAIINSKLETKDTGALSKIVGTVLMNATMNAPETRKVIHDCGTKNHRTITIKDKKDLKFYRYTYYLKDDGKTYDYIDLNRTDLIGKTIKIRSIALCEGDTVCEMCFGRLHKYNQDTSVTKMNYGIRVLVTLAAILQGVISIKHSISGDLQDIHIEFTSHYVHLKDLKKTLPNLVTRVGYNTIAFNKGNREFVLTKDRDTYNLYIDSKQFKLVNSEIVDILTNNDNVLEIKITLPNKSVLTKADDLQMALKRHNQAPEFKEGWDKDKTYIEKVDYIIKFFNKYIGFKHNIFAETLSYCMIRDSEDCSKRPTSNSQGITLIKVQDVINRPDYSSNLSSTIPYGHVEKQLMFIKSPNRECVEASDYDILYMSKNKDKELSPYLKINRIVNKLLYDYEDGE